MLGNSVDQFCMCLRPHLIRLFRNRCASEFFLFEFFGHMKMPPPGVQPLDCVSHFVAPPASPAAFITQIQNAESFAAFRAQQIRPAAAEIAGGVCQKHFLFVNFSLESKMQLQAVLLHSNCNSEEFCVVPQMFLENYCIRNQVMLDFSKVQGWEVFYDWPSFHVCLSSAGSESAHVVPPCRKIRNVAGPGVRQDRPWFFMPPFADRLLHVP
ncbi:MAG TPA: hypothetical protein VJ946_04615 [Bacteroidales bacterium]|nr:hypothetical protein [Bacteroidales bacterium]